MTDDLALLARLLSRTIQSGDCRIWQGAREGRFKNAKLLPSDIFEIRKKIAAGGKHPEIARQFGVSSQTISKINRGERWGHV